MAAIGWWASFINFLQTLWGLIKNIWQFIKPIITTILEQLTKFLDHCERIYKRINWLLDIHKHGLRAVRDKLLDFLKKEEMDFRILRWAIDKAYNKAVKWTNEKVRLIDPATRQKILNAFRPEFGEIWEYIFKVEDWVDRIDEIATVTDEELDKLDNLVKEKMKPEVEKNIQLREEIKNPQDPTFTDRTVSHLTTNFNRIDELEEKLFSAPIGRADQILTLKANQKYKLYEEFDANLSWLEYVELMEASGVRWPLVKERIVSERGALPIVLLGFDYIWTMENLELNHFKMAYDHVAVEYWYLATPEKPFVMPYFSKTERKLSTLFEQRGKLLKKYEKLKDVDPAEAEKVSAEIEALDEKILELRKQLLREQIEGLSPEEQKTKEEYEKGVLVPPEA